MMRFYGLTDRQCLVMPISRLMLLHKQINILEVEEEIRDLLTVHAGNPRERLDTLTEQLYALSPRHRPRQSTEAIMQRPAGKLVAEFSDGDAFRAELERMRAADAQRRAEWEARQRAEVQPSGVLQPPAPTPEGAGLPGSPV